MPLNKSLTITPLPAFKDNYLWLLTPNNRKAVVVDPGDAQPVLDYLTQNKLTLEAILITHHHWDHTNGMNKLLLAFDVPVYGPDSDKIPQISHPLKDGELQFKTEPIRMKTRWCTACLSK